MASCRWMMLLIAGAGLSPFLARGQIDPDSRELFQFGYNQALQGHPPLSAYAFYYHNHPEFIRPNWTLRLALAPTYLDSELGIGQALGPFTDVGFGLAGGGFVDSYYEIRQGKYLPAESFDGYGGEVNASIYHLFNPAQEIPLTGVLRGMAHYSTFASTSDTAPTFQAPPDEGIFSLRTGLRWGGREPTLFPALAMELSVWYQADFRTQPETYGFGDRRIEEHTHQFWGQALLAYTLPRIAHSFHVSLTAGTSANADRFSAYRLGALLPLAAEYPLSLPGYYFQEISADNFVLFGGNYIIPLDQFRRWNLNFTAATALVDYLPGLEQAGNWHSGVGGGIFYTTPSWRVMLGYGYGIDAIRSDGRGAHSLGLLLQFDLEEAREAFYRPDPTSQWRGFQRILGVLGN